MAQTTKLKCATDILLKNGAKQQQPRGGERALATEKKTTMPPQRRRASENRGRLFLGLSIGQSVSVSEEEGHMYNVQGWLTRGDTPTSL